MDVKQTELLAGVLFLLIAIVGGGFAVKEISIPKVPSWARIVSAIVGVVLVALSIWPQDDVPDGPVRVHEDAGPAASRHGLVMTDLIVEAPRKQPHVGETVTFAFMLRNTGQDPFTFVEIFVGARGPARDNRDFGGSHEGLTLAPGATIRFATSKIPDVPGVWTFWPCYAVAGETGEDEYCPDRWREFQVFVTQ